MFHSSRPALPPGVLYRHNLWFAIWLLVVAELMTILFAFPLWLAGTGGKVVLCALCLGVLLFWLGQILRIERNGWWVYCPANPPDLPLQWSGLGWNAIFDSQGVRVQSNTGAMLVFWLTPTSSLLMQRQEEADREEKFSSSNMAKRH